MNSPPRVEGVTFDFGQTLAALDEKFLSARLLEKGIEVSQAALERAMPFAWQVYNRAVATPGAHAWREFMGAVLSKGGVTNSQVAGLVESFWREQPARNLWRRPLAEMMGLVERLRRRGVPLAVISNSEGRLLELISELGWAHYFDAVADSGKLGVEKPSADIFEWTARKLGKRPEALAHVGDSLAADVEGALAAGLSAIWFAPPPEVDAAAVLAERGPAFGEGRAVFCRDAREVAAALGAWGLLPSN